MPYTNIMKQTADKADVRSLNADTIAIAISLPQPEPKIRQSDSFPDRVMPDYHYSELEITSNQHSKYQKIREATMMIPFHARLEECKHDASHIIGYALCDQFGAKHRVVGSAIATEWDERNNGNSFSVFIKADPFYIATLPISVASIFMLARQFEVMPSTDEWPDPAPLMAYIAQAEYPLDALPGIVRHAVEDVEGFVKAPIPLIAQSALAAMSLAIQAHVDVERAVNLDGPCSLFMLAIADSGERKTTCDGYFTKPIREYEACQHEKAGPLLAAYETEIEAWQAQRGGVKERIKLLAKDGKFSETQITQLHDLDAKKPRKRRVPKLTFADSTPDSLVSSLVKEWPSGGILSSEAGVVFGGHGMGRDSIMRNLAILNQLWDGHIDPVDRKTTDSFSSTVARLTMSLQVQESTLRAFLSNTKGLARGTGFLARFLVSWPESTQGTRFFTEAPANWPAMATFNGRLTLILDRPAPIDPMTGHLTPGGMLTLAPDAKAAWVEFHDQIEKELLVGGELFEVRDVASKTADNAARMAALFHIFSGSVGQIDLDAMESAARITLWHLTESKRFLGELAMPPELVNPARLETWMLDYCKRMGTDNVGTREIQRNGPYGLRDKSVIAEAVKELIELGRVRLVTVGKRKSVQMNPALLTTSK